MATLNMYTYVQWTANDGSPDSIGSLTTPAQYTYSNNETVDRSVVVPDSTATKVYDAAVDPAASFLILVNSGVTGADLTSAPVWITYIGDDTDVDSSTFCLRIGCAIVLSDARTLPYNAVPATRAAGAAVPGDIQTITDVWAYQTTGYDLLLRVVAGN